MLSVYFMDVINLNLYNGRVILRRVVKYFTGNWNRGHFRDLSARLYRERWAYSLGSEKAVNPIKCESILVNHCVSVRCCDCCQPASPDAGHFSDSHFIYLRGRNGSEKMEKFWAYQIQWKRYRPVLWSLKNWTLVFKLFIERLVNNEIIIARSRVNWKPTNERFTSYSQPIMRFDAVPRTPHWYWNDWTQTLF